MAIAFCIVSFGMSTVFAQIGIGTGSVNTSAQLEVASTSKGFLPPRMTTTQRNAITSAANGLIIYNTDSAKLQVRENSQWIEFVTRKGNESGQIRSRAAIAFFDTVQMRHYATFPSSGSLWDGITTSTTNWIKLTTPNFSNVIVYFDSQNLLAARNLGPTIYYKPTGVNSSIQLSASGIFNTFGVMSCNSIAIGVFKTSGPSGSRVTTLVPGSVRIMENQGSSSAIMLYSLRLTTTVGPGESFDLRVAQIGGTYTGSTTGPPAITMAIQFKSLNFTGIVL